MGRYGFSKLCVARHVFTWTLISGAQRRTQHHRTAEHGLQLQQRILKASNAPTTTADTLPALTAAAVAGPPVTVKSTTSTVPNIARFFAMSPSARKQKEKNTQGTGYRTPVLEPGTCSPSVIRT